MNARHVSGRAIFILSVALVGLGLSGCSKKERVGGDYVLVTPATMGPDHHPGTTLKRKGTVVWGNVYTGYFHPVSAAHFYHDNLFVFVGPVPFESDWSSYSQLYAVRDDGPPVRISDRLIGETLLMSNDSRDPRNVFAVDSLVAEPDGIRVRFTHQMGTIHHDPDFIHISWTRIRQLLDEAESSGTLVRHPLGDYRVLVPEAPPALRSSIGEMVTLIGIAEPRKSGAALRGEDFYVWLKEIPAWPEDVVGQKVQVKGRLEEDHGLPVFVSDPNQLPAQGIPVPKETDLNEASRRLILVAATWEKIE